MLNDDCLGRTLDWIADHDPTMLFAGIAQQARSRFDLSIKRIHTDTTSFSVSGAMKQIPKQLSQFVLPLLMATHGITVKIGRQWMLGLVTSSDGDVPLFMRPLDGTSLDKVSISALVAQVIEQLRGSQGEPTPEEPLVVFDSGGYSEANIKSYNEAKIRWCSRVPAAVHRGQSSSGASPQGMARVL